MTAIKNSQGFSTRAVVDARRAEAEAASALVAERRAAIAGARAGQQAATGDAGGAGAAIKAALQNGAEIPGCSLRQGETIQIR